MIELELTRTEEDHRRYLLEGVSARFDSKVSFPATQPPRRATSTGTSPVAGCGNASYRPRTH